MQPGKLRVWLVTGHRKGVVRHTLDQTEPTTDSPICHGELSVAPGTEIRARAFVGQEPFGDVKMITVKVPKPLTPWPS